MHHQDALHVPSAIISSTTLNALLDAEMESKYPLSNATIIILSTMMDAVLIAPRRRDSFA